MEPAIITLAAGVALALTGPAAAQVKSVVLVHGAFADGSGWKPVADILQRDGYFGLRGPGARDVVSGRCPLPPGAWPRPSWPVRPCRAQLRRNDHHRGGRAYRGLRKL